MHRSTAIIASRSNVMVDLRAPAFGKPVEGNPGNAQASHVYISSRHQNLTLVTFALAFWVTFSIASKAAECRAPTKQNQLQTLSECTNSMCCPRELNLQINLVRTVAGKLKALGYSISDPNSKPEDSPDLSGIYYPALRSAVRQYKQDQKISDGNEDITYELVADLLGIDLFERWRRR